MFNKDADLIAVNAFDIFGMLDAAGQANQAIS